MSERMVKIPIYDYIDLYVALKEAQPRWIAEDLLLDFFPNDMSEKDIKSYWLVYNLIDERQRPAIEDSVNELRRKLIKMGKWKVI